VRQHGVDRLLLVGPERTTKLHLQTRPGRSLVLQLGPDAVLAQHSERCFEASAWQGNVLWKVLRAANDPGLVPHRKAHGLRLVELGVLERGQADQAVGQRLRQSGLLEVHQVGQRDLQRGRHGAGQAAGRWLLPTPRRGLVFAVDECHVEGMTAARGAQDRGLDVCGRHLGQAGQEGPLVIVGLQVAVDEDAAPAFAGRLLQRQGDEVAEASDAGAARPRLAGRHRVLVRKQPVVGAELQLAGACTGVADEGGAQPAGIACRHPAGEEKPGMCPIA
jgi:hypothetical protein